MSIGDDHRPRRAHRAFAGDANLTPHLVILGGGQAGYQLAASAREGGFAGKVTIIGEEPALPYQRPPLSKDYLASKIDEEGIVLRPETFYASHRIDLLMGERAIAIDRVGRVVSLASGSVIAYDHLVLALGARNRTLDVPGAELEGVLSLRSLADARSLRDWLGAARKLLVIGAGFIGLEIAASAHKRGLEIECLELGPRVMGRAVSEPMSRFFEGAHRDWGTGFRFNTAAQRMIGHQGRVVAVETREGERLQADLVVVGVGVVPNTELASACGLAVA
ncbi:MAG TPA: FAD-dependent oxidoreductase, partial [Stellaceae bacterium]|nr:FAD-dependent oxidoreductase [Stellaceae bacterium]